MSCNEINIKEFPIKYSMPLFKNLRLYNHINSKLTIRMICLHFLLEWWKYHKEYYIILNVWCSITFLSLTLNDKHRTLLVIKTYSIEIARIIFVFVCISAIKREKDNIVGWLSHMQIVISGVLHPKVLPW